MLLKQLFSQIYWISSKTAKFFLIAENMVALTGLMENEYRYPYGRNSADLAQESR